MFHLQTANESAMEEDLGLIGASAEDTEAELIRKICETELLAGMKTNLFSDIFYSPLFKNCGRCCKIIYTSSSQRRTCCVHSFLCW